MHKLSFHNIISLKPRWPAPLTAYELQKGSGLLKSKGLRCKRHLLLKEEGKARQKKWQCCNNKKETGCAQPRHALSFSAWSRLSSTTTTWVAIEQLRWLSSGPTVMRGVWRHVTLCAGVVKADPHHIQTQKSNWTRQPILLIMQTAGRPSISDVCPTTCTHWLLDFGHLSLARTQKEELSDAVWFTCKASFKFEGYCFDFHL